MSNAGNGGKYDFKSRGNRSKDQSVDQYNYRGMPLSGVKGIEGSRVYGSARDVGNFAAGFVSAARGLDWGQMRIGFDFYQSHKNAGTTQEAMVSQAAQRLGYEKGRQYRMPVLIYNKAKKLFTK